MSRSPRSSHSRNEEKNFSDELDDMLAAPALKPSLRFLGLEESEPAALSAITASSASPALATLTASPAVIAGDAVMEFGAEDIVRRPVLVERPPQPAPKPNPAADAPEQITVSPAVIASPAVTESVGGKKKRIHHCVKVQDGHSHVEQAVYQILWNAGTPQPEGTRMCSLGLPRIAKEACVHERNIGMIIRRLVQKRALEIIQKEASELRSARIYRIFGYRDILERRKEAGLEWVVRGRGVEFVNPDTAHPLFRDEDLLIGRVTAGGAVTAGDTPAVTAGPPPAVTAPAPPRCYSGGFRK